MGVVASAWFATCRTERILSALRDSRTVAGGNQVSPHDLAAMLGSSCSVHPATPGMPWCYEYVWSAPAQLTWPDYNGQRKSVHPIAAPATRPRWIEDTGGASDVPTPTATVMSFRSAVSHAGPPIEEGERCHICDKPALVEQLHIAWCSTCACALLAWRNIPSYGPDVKAACSDHALDHAFRWHRVVRRLLSSIDDNSRCAPTRFALRAPHS